MRAPGALFQRRAVAAETPELTDMVIFRENTEDIYAGIEWQAESADAQKLIAFLQNELGVKQIRFPECSGVGVKPGFA